MSPVYGTMILLLLLVTFHGISAAGPPTILTSDSTYEYYKVPIPWGTTLVNKAITTTCDEAGMAPLCYENRFPHKVEGCILTDKGGRSMYDMAEFLGCTGNSAGIRQCEKLHGIFTVITGWSHGACGVTKYDFCARGKTYTSSHRFQYWALCGKPFTTTTPTTITMGPPTILTSDSTYEYYKVPIPWGTTLVNKAITTTCDEAEMAPLCWGNYHPYKVEG